MGWPAASSDDCMKIMPCVSRNPKDWASEAGSFGDGSFYVSAYVINPMGAGWEEAPVKPNPGGRGLMLVD